VAVAKAQPRPGRVLIVMGLIVLALYGVMFATGATTPKLALDLAGGTSVTLTATGQQGAVTPSAMRQVIEIIRQRVDASGIGESEVKAQGSNNVVVEVPGLGQQALVERIGRTARLFFRPVMVVGGPTDTADSLPGARIPTELTKQFNELDCANPQSGQGSQSEATEPIAACDQNGLEKYILGPVAINGTDLTDASAQLASSPTGVAIGGWIVNLNLNDNGAKAFADITRSLFQAPQDSPENRFAIVLDGVVVSAPGVNEPITGGQATIQGDFTQQEAQDLATVLKFGALPLDLTVSEVNEVSAILGSDQLTKGLLAGAIGLGLVVVYSLLYYRGLGIVTVFSLVVAALLTYGTAVLLGPAMGFALSLAGVAGLIVAIGVIADSFVIFFERLRDEIREGRSLRAAVEHGWSRARRTILAADFVSFLAAVVLYILSVGAVRGFAFTLGLTTLIDVVVVFLFTKPLVTLFARTKFFANGHPLSGLDPRRRGGRATGASRSAQPKEA